MSNGRCVYFVFITFANSVDPDQTPHYSSSDLGLHYLPMSLWRDTMHEWLIAYHRRNCTRQITWSLINLMHRLARILAVNIWHYTWLAITFLDMDWRCLKTIHLMMTRTVKYTNLYLCKCLSVCYTKMIYLCKEDLQLKVSYTILSGSVKLKIHETIMTSPVTRNGWLESHYKKKKHCFSELVFRNMTTKSSITSNLIRCSDVHLSPLTFSYYHIRTDRLCKRGRSNKSQHRTWSLIRVYTMNYLSISMLDTFSDSNSVLSLSHWKDIGCPEQSEHLIPFWYSIASID